MTELRERKLDAVPRPGARFWFANALVLPVLAIGFFAIAGNVPSGLGRARWYLAAVVALAITATATWHMPQLYEMPQGRRAGYTAAAVVMQAVIGAVDWLVVAAWLAHLANSFDQGEN